MTSTRLYWNLLNNGLMLEFVQWLRNEYPLVFKNLVNQFIHRKEAGS